MSRFKLALQLYSVRNNMEKDFEKTLDMVRNMGYDGVEFAGLFGKKPQEVKAICESINLIPISAHVPFADMIQDPESVMKTYKEIGCKYIVIPYLTPEYRPGKELFNDVIRGAVNIGKVANKYGMQLLYHNHDFEFTRLNGQYALDILYSNVSEEYLKTELDTCWVKVGGEDPSSYILKYSGRTPIVHLKDYNGIKSDNMYKLIGIESKNIENKGEFEFRPVGYGVLDFVNILNASQDAGAEWVTVEQDEPSLKKTELECAQMSADYLKPIL